MSRTAEEQRSRLMHALVLPFYTHPTPCSDSRRVMNTKFKLTLEEAEKYPHMTLDKDRSDIADDNIENFYLFEIRRDDGKQPVWSLIQNNSEDRIGMYGHFYLCHNAVDYSLSDLKIILKLEQFFENPYKPTEHEIQLFKLEKNLDYPIKGR